MEKILLPTALSDYKFVYTISIAANTVLLITGEPPERSRALKALGRCGVPMATVACHDANVGIDYLARTGDFVGRAEAEPCFVLFEVDRPTPEVLETLRQFRSARNRPTIPLVLLCCDGTAQECRAAYHAGANSLLVAPADQVDLAADMRKTHDYWVSLNCSALGSAQLM